ncbi:MAG: hypothetical protein AAGA92_11030 [Planctomycetota bacterium]
MKNTVIVLAVLALSIGAGTAGAEPGYMRAKRRAQQYNWHANYNYTLYGAPTALVVPPTANLQTHWSWGAPSMHVSRLDHQFGRSYPGAGPFGGGYNYTPMWPADTAQFGVYHVRGPWYPTQP